MVIGCPFPKGAIWKEVMIVDLLDKIMAFEAGDLSGHDIVDLFAELVRTGEAWSLQGSYGRGAVALIQQGYIDRAGNVLKYP